MTKSFTINGIRFVVLILLQVIICNQINFLDYINPYIYILFILLYNINNNRSLFLILSFILGFIVDVFSDTAGVHATASLCMAYARPVALKLSYGLQYEHQNLKFNPKPFGNLLYYIAMMTLLHHLVLFSLEIFSVNHLLLILKKALFSSIFTIVLSFIIILLFSKAET